MKQLKLIASTIIIAACMAFVACKSSSDKSDSSKTDNDSEKMTTSKPDVEKVTEAQDEKMEAYPVGEAGKGPHGGIIEEAEPNHIEMVADGKDFVFYLLDDETKPMTMKDVTGSVKMQYSKTKTKTIDLMAMNGKLTAKQANSGHAYTAVCTLTKDGKSYSATFKQ